MLADLIIHNIKTLYTPYLRPPLRGDRLKDIKVINNAYIAIRAGRIMDIGSSTYRHLEGPFTKLVDAKGKIALPGFIDSHTHLVHAGSREHEFASLKAGVPYLEILENGGGILNTVEKTREATSEELFKQSKRSLKTMIRHGVTVVEAKSGYGLNLEQEIKQLEVAEELNKVGPVQVISTYMGAHAIPLEFKGRTDDYVNQIVRDLSEIKKLKYVETVDVFCEQGVFDLVQSEKILTKAQNLGFDVRIHADEMAALGGAGLGVKLGAKSVDHLLMTTDHDIMLLGQSDTYGVILPGTSFNLQKPYAKARQMVDSNVAICIAGDYNPGSCPTENFQLIMQLAASRLSLSPEEILSAVTINPAHLLGVSKDKGSIEIDKDADIILLDAPNLNYIFYHFGINHVTDVFVKGAQIVTERDIIGEYK